MSNSNQPSSQITNEDIQAMKSWFKTHRDNSHNGARTFEEYVILIRNAIGNNDQPFLKNALRFFGKIGGSGFDKINAESDLTYLTNVVK